VTYQGSARGGGHTWNRIFNPSGENPCGATSPEKAFGPKESYVVRCQRCGWSHCHCDLRSIAQQMRQGVNTLPYSLGRDTEGLCDTQHVTLWCLQMYGGLQFARGCGRLACSFREFVAVRSIADEIHRDRAELFQCCHTGLSGEQHDGRRSTFVKMWVLPYPEVVVPQ
jgi:hypothetical protein